MIALEEMDDAAGSTWHGYPTSAMIGDYLRTAAGLVPVGVLFATTPVGGTAELVLGGIAAIFGVFGLRTVMRHGTSIELTDTELRAHGASRRTLSWAELDRMKLAYYSTRRDRKSGWMQLQLGAGGARVSLDSRIAGFNQLVQRAAAVAGMRGIELSEATVANLEALGVRLPEPGTRR